MGRLKWFGHVERNDDTDWVKQCMIMEIEGTTQRDARWRPGEIVSRKTRRVLACPERMLRTKITVD